MNRTLARAAVGLLAVAVGASATAPAFAAASPPTAIRSTTAKPAPKPATATKPAPKPATATKPAPKPRPTATHPVGGIIFSQKKVAAHPRPGAQDTLPASVDLRQYAPPVGDQGQIGDCAAWSIAHSMMGYYATRTGGSGAPYAPLYLYLRSNPVGGPPNGGLYMSTALNEAQTNGVDTQDDYFQGTSTWQTPPTASEIANAANYKITGWNTLWTGAGNDPNGNKKLAVEQALASESPVLIGMPVYQDFYSLSGNVVYNHTSGSYIGGHAVTAFGYDSQGIWIRNQWGTYWGYNGDAHLSWTFVESYLNEAYTVNGLSTPAQPKTIAPTVIGMSTHTGTTNGGSTVTITGASLASATAVNFGTVNASFTSVVNNGVTQLVATVPAQAAGIVNVTVTNPGGTSPVGTASKFTYVPPPPAVTGLSVSSVSIFGGTTVTVTGANFIGSTYVRVGGTGAGGVHVLSPTSLTFVTPAKVAGTVDVTVTTPYGTSTIGSADKLTYLNPPPPVVSGLSPTSAYTYLATPVTLTGSYLTGTTKVTAGGVAVPFVRVSDTQVRATVPPHVAGTLDLQVTTPGGTSTTSSADQFTYVTPPAPTVTGLSVTSAYTYLATPVVITGTNFLAVSKVTLGGVAVPFSRLSDTQVRATVPPHVAGTLDLQVTTPGGASTTSSADQFTYVTPPAPTVTGLSVSSGYTVLSSTILVNGANFLAVSKVTLAGTAVPFSRLSETQLRVTLPVHAAGVFDIQVTTPGGTSTIGSADRLTYVTPSVPTITGLSVTSGATSTSTSVLVNGTGYVLVTRVTVGGAAVAFTRVSDTQLKVTMPPHAAGVVDVQVTAAGGTSATSSADRFTYGVSAATFRSWPARVLHWLGF